MSTLEKYLPRTVHAAQWFGANARTLTDVAAYRAVISEVRAEIADARTDLSGLVLAALLDEYPDLDRGIQEAEALIGRIENRIRELGEEPSPVAARLVSTVAAYLGASDPESIELGWL